MQLDFVFTYFFWDYYIKGKLEKSASNLLITSTNIYGIVTLMMTFIINAAQIPNHVIVATS